MGQVVLHKTLGPFEVLEVVDNLQGKIVGKVQSTGETKKLIFTTQFFPDAEEYETAQITVQKKALPKRVHKQVDMAKYRNHPLVKKIDEMEDRRARVIAADVDDDEEDED